MLQLSELEFRETWTRSCWTQLAGFVEGYVQGMKEVYFLFSVDTVAPLTTPKARKKTIVPRQSIFQLNSTLLSTNRSNFGDMSSKQKLGKKERERLQREEEERQEKIEKAQEEFEAAVSVLQQEEITVRKTINTESLKAFSIITQRETLQDWKHAEPYDAERRLWPCCGVKEVVGQRGCTIVTDPFKPMIHDGQWIPAQLQWSCCNSKDIQSPGCKLPPRYVFTPPVWEDLHPRMSVGFKDRLRIVSLKGSVTMTKYPGPRKLLHAEWCTVVTEQTYTAKETPSVCWEVSIDMVPPHNHSGGQLMIVGVVRSSFADTEECEKTLIGGENGIGWWQSTPLVRGMGQRYTLLPFTPHNLSEETIPSTYKFTDSITLHLDFQNSQLSFFLNSKYVGSVNIDPREAYTPAVTLIPESSVTFVHRGRKEKDIAMHVSEQVMKAYKTARNLREERVLDLDDLVGL